MKYVVAGLMMLCAPALAETAGDAPKTAVAVRERQVMAATYMGKVQNDAGHFGYEFDFLTGTWSEEDSLVRQAGAGYGLSEYLLSHRDAAAKKVVAKALKAYRKDSVPFRSGKVLSDGKNLSSADTGATALALAAAIQYRKATGDRQFDDDIKAWKTGLLALHNPKGGFASSPKDPKESSYYNGEAWLALSIYVVEFPEDAKAKDVLKAVDRAMIRTYSKTPEIGFFHWGQMATAQRYETTKDKIFSDFGARQATAFLTDLRPRVSKKSNTCYSVEGLSAILPVLKASKEHADLAAKVERRIRDEMTKNVGFQILPGQKAITLPRDRSLTAPELPDYVGAFLNGLGRPQIRIDFTQHCLSAMLKSARYLED